MSVEKCPRCGAEMKEISMNDGVYNRRRKTLICEPCTINDSVNDLGETKVETQTKLIFI